MSRIARLGALLLVTSVLLLVGIFKIGDRRLLFSKTYRLQAAFDQVGGLLSGADVRVGGVRKGVVDDIRLPRQPGEKVAVILRLDQETHGVVKRDSVASIDTEGLLGNKIVSVSFGSKEAEPVRDGDLISTRPPLDFSDMLVKSNDILDSTRSATSDLQSITSKIDRGEGTVGALINDKAIYQHVSAATADARETVAQAKIGVTAFKEDMQALKANWFFRGFFNKRGYLDSTELTKHEIERLPSTPFLKRFIYHAKDIFDRSDTAKLKNEKTLNQAGQFMEQTPFGLAVITAYTDLTGDQEENLVLSQARAMVVRNYLADKFKLEDAHLKTRGMGEDGASEPDKASRVEVVIYPVSAKPESAARLKK